MNCKLQLISYKGEGERSISHFIHVRDKDIIDPKATICIGYFPSNNPEARWAMAPIDTPLGSINCGADVAERFATEFLDTLWPYPPLPEDEDSCELFGADCSVCHPDNEEQS